VVGDADGPGEAAGLAGCERCALWVMVSRFAIVLALCDWAIDLVFLSRHSGESRNPVSFALFYTSKGKELDSGFRRNDELLEKTL
jgi:hypothetical protein